MTLWRCEIHASPLAYCKNWTRAKWMQVVTTHILELVCIKPHIAQLGTSLHVYVSVGELEILWSRTESNEVQKAPYFYNGNLSSSPKLARTSWLIIIITLCLWKTAILFINPCHYCYYITIVLCTCYNIKLTRTFFVHLLFKTEQFLAERTCQCCCMIQTDDEFYTFICIYFHT